MWRVYLHEDSWEVGITMNSEKECFEYCLNNEGYTYSYKYLG